jgi:hypothetical protein
LKPDRHKFDIPNHRCVVETQDRRFRELRNCYQDVSLADLQKRQLDLKGRFNVLKSIIVQYDGEVCLKDFEEVKSIPSQAFRETGVYKNVVENLEPWEHVQMAAIGERFKIERSSMHAVFEGEVASRQRAFQVCLYTFLSLCLTC